MVKGKIRRKDRLIIDRVGLLIITLIVLLPISLLTEINTVRPVKAGGEGNVDSFDVHPNYRWNEKEIGDTLDTTVEKSVIKLSSSDEAIYTTNRRLQKTKDKIEVKALIPSTNSQTNVGIRANKPESVTTDQEYFFSDPESDLISFWDMNYEMGSYDTRDCTGNAHILTLDEAGFNSTTYTGRSEYSLYMNSYHGNNYAYSLDHDDYSFVNSTGDTPFSLEIWINLESTGSFKGLITKYGVVGNREYSFYLDSNEKIRFNCYDSNEVVIYTSSVLEIDINTWYHVVVTYDGSENETGMSIYVDGVNEQTQGSSGSYTGMVNTDEDVILGRLETNYFDGLMDDVKIYSKELSSDEILRFYHEGRKGEVLYLKMNEGSGTTAYDSSQDHDATLVNSPTWEDSSVDSEYYSCLDFDATDSDYLSIADHDDFSFGDSSNDVGFSISVWLNLKALTATHQYIVVKNNEYYLYLFTTGEIGFYCRDLSTVSYIGRRVTTPLNFDSWYHLVVTYDGSATEGGIDIYLNGLKVDDGSYSGGVGYVAMENTVNDVDISKNVNFDGKFDEIKIFRDNLTSTEVAYLYANQSQLLIQNRLEKKIPTQTTDGNTVRIVFERDYLTGNSICYGAFENYQNETIKSISNIYHYYSSSESDKWLLIELKYNTRKSIYSFNVEFFNGTEILDTSISDFSEQMPSISNYSQFYAYYSIINVEKTYTELLIDYVKVSFHEQEFTTEGKIGSGDTNFTTQGFTINKNNANEDLAQQLWFLDVPYFDSCSGTIAFSVTNWKNWLSDGLGGSFWFNIYSVNPTTGVLIDDNVKFRACLYDEPVVPPYLPSFFVATALGDDPFYVSTDDNVTHVIEWVTHFDKTQNVLKLTISCDNVVVTLSHDFTWSPQEFVLLLRYDATANASMVKNEQLTISLTDWGLKSRDLLDFLPPLPINLPDVGAVVDFAGNLFVVLIRLFNSLISSTLESIIALGSILIAIVSITGIINLIINQITNLPNAVFSVFNVVLTSIDNALGNLPSLIFTAFQSILTDIETAITGLANGVWLEFSSILSSIDDYLADMGNVVFTAFTGIMDDIWDAIGNVSVLVLAGLLAIFVDGMETLWNAFAPFVSDLVTYWIDAMVALIAYLWNNFLNPLIAFIVDFLFITFPELKALWDWLWQLVIFFFDELEPLIDTIAYVLTFIWTIILLLSELLLASIDFLSQLTDLINDLINDNYVLSYTLGVFIPAYEIDVEIINKVMKFTIVPEISIVLMEFNFPFNLLPQNFPISGSFSDLWFWIIGTFTWSIIGLYLIVTACISCLINSAKGRFEWGSFFDTWYLVAIDKPLNGIMFVRNFIPLI